MCFPGGIGQLSIIHKPIMCRSLCTFAKMIKRWSKERLYHKIDKTLLIMLLLDSDDDMSDELASESNSKIGKIQLGMSSGAQMYSA